MAKSIHLCSPLYDTDHAIYTLGFSRETHLRVYYNNIIFNRRSKKNTVTTTIDWFIASGQAHRVLCPIIILLNRLRGSFHLINSDTCSFIVSPILFSTDSLHRSYSKYEITKSRNII